MCSAFWPGTFFLDGRFCQKLVAIVVVIMIMAVVMVVVMLIVVFVMSVGMTIGVIFFVDPIAWVVAIAALEMFILRVRPDGSGIRWTLIVPSDPAIGVPLGGPETAYPNGLRCRGRRCRRFETRRWGGDADGDGYLCGCRQGQSRCKRELVDPDVFHTRPPMSWRQEPLAGQDELRRQVEQLTCQLLYKGLPATHQSHVGGIWNSSVSGENRYW